LSKKRSKENESILEDMTISRAIALCFLGWLFVQGKFVLQVL